MTDTEIKESQNKIKNIKCPKCKDAKLYVDKTGEVKTCLEC